MVFTIVRLAYGASFESACQLAGISPKEVNLTQAVGEKTETEKLPQDFRIISFDGNQITISERIDGECRVRGFAVTEHPPATPGFQTDPRPA